MGMGYSSNSVSIITVENMEKLLPRQMKKLNSILENNNEDISRTEFFMDFYEFEVEVAGDRYCRCWYD